MPRNGPTPRRQGGGPQTIYRRRSFRRTPLPVAARPGPGALANGPGNWPGGSCDHARASIRRRILGGDEVAGIASFLGGHLDQDAARGQRVTIQAERGEFVGHRGMKFSRFQARANQLRFYRIERAEHSDEWHDKLLYQGWRLFLQVWIYDLRFTIYESAGESALTVPALRRD